MTIKIDKNYSCNFYNRTIANYWVLVGLTTTKIYTVIDYNDDYDPNPDPNRLSRGKIRIQLIICGDFFSSIIPFLVKIQHFRL